jgi:hypothetical protein
MYTQEVVCPYCGKLTRVNVIDTDGRTETPCQSCKRGIFVGTDKEGKVVSIEKEEGCFLTTACVQAAGLSDDCKELRALRRFRDEYVAQLPNGASILTQYYENSPQIVLAISNSPLAEAEYDEILSVVRDAVAHIEAGNNSNALSVYSELINKLAKKYLS